MTRRPCRDCGREAGPAGYCLTCVQKRARKMEAGKRIKLPEKR